MFHGVIPPIITPFNGDGRIDEAFLRSHVDFLIECGVHGIFCLGSTGEFIYLSDEEKLKVMEVVVEETSGRVPVIVGVSHFSCKVSIEYTKAAERLGADGVASILLPYFPITDEMAYEYYVSLAKSTSLPLIIYNFPALTNFDIKPETVAKLAELENIVGIKDTVIDARHTIKIIELVPEEFSVFPGSEVTLQTVMEAGAKGMILGSSNIDPKPAVELYEAYKAGDIAKARFLLPKALNMLQVLSIAPIQYLPSIVKNAIKLTGRPVNTAVRPPLPSLSEEQQEKLRKAMADAGLL